MKLGAAKIAFVLLLGSPLFVASMVEGAPGSDASPAKPGAKPPKKPPKAAKTKSSSQRSPHAGKFDHDAHSKLDTPVPVAECGKCHGDDTTGKLATPGAVGHQPCLSAGCHAEDFMSVGARTLKEAPERYRQAASFCSGCHKLETDVAPSPFAKMDAPLVYKGNKNPNYHVEMNHLEHVGKTKCRTCHVVEKETFALQFEAPGHDQCATCHGEDNEELTMADCAGCHQEGNPDKYFKPRTFESDVRSCDSDRYKELVKARGGKSVPCFKHEREGHRYVDGKDLQCNACHFMFEAKSYNGFQYESLKGIKAAPLMDNRGERAHRKCGASGCHRAQVNESSGGGNCNLCHSSQSILSGLLGGGGGSRRNTPANDETEEKQEGGNAGTKSPRRDGSGLDSLTEGGKGKRKRRKKKKESLDDLVD